MSYQIEKDWITKAGLRAVVILVTDLGHRCGYVGLTKKHPLYGIPYNEESAYLKFPEKENIGKRGILAVICSNGKATPEVVFDVHGSITYSGGRDYPVKSDGLWWFGFDCGHLGDGREASFHEISGLRNLYADDPIRDTEFCVQECESLAQQLVDRIQVTE